MLSYPRHLVPLLLVHGTLCRYRLERLTTYSFYKVRGVMRLGQSLNGQTRALSTQCLHSTCLKVAWMYQYFSMLGALISTGVSTLLCLPSSTVLQNVAFFIILFVYQPFCGWSGQAVVDDISSALYNVRQQPISRTQCSQSCIVHCTRSTSLHIIHYPIHAHASSLPCCSQVVFTALPILIYALLDRPARDSVLLAHPTLYASSGRVVNLYSFWIEGIVLGVVHGEGGGEHANRRGDNSLL
jgi:hypothetical protein